MPESQVPGINSSIIVLIEYEQNIFIVAPSPPHPPPFENCFSAQECAMHWGYVVIYEDWTIYSLLLQYIKSLFSYESWENKLFFLSSHFISFFQDFITIACDWNCSWKV